MTEEEKKTIEQMFEAMGNTGGRFVIGQVVGSQTINFNGKTPVMKDNGDDAKSSNNKQKGGRPKRSGKPITKSFRYDVGDETNIRLQMLYNGLINQGWIKDDTDLRSFLSVFSGKDTMCRIVWTGEISSLAELFKELVTRKGLVQLPQGESLWVMVNARFWEKEGNKEFGNKRLGSTQAPIDNKETIDLLVKVMNPEIKMTTLKASVQTRK